MTIRREPAMAIAGVAAVVTAALALLMIYGVLDARQAAAWEMLALALIPLVQGWATRSVVFAPATLEDAGLNPEAVKHAAEDERGRD